MQPSHFSRRRALEIGVLGALSLTLPDYLRARAQAGDSAGSPRSVIFMFLHGGLSQYETFDPKPNAPDVYRGPFGTIHTKVPDIIFGERLPELAKVADKLVVLRSLHHRDGDHPAAVHQWKTGFRGGAEPNRDQNFPSVGAVAARVCGDRRPDLPSYVVLPRTLPSWYDAPHYLGSNAAPFVVGLKPNVYTADTESLRLPQGVTVPRVEDRRRLLKHLDTLRRNSDYQGQISALDTFEQKALDLTLGETARRAMDLEQEDTRVRDRYGRNYFGQSVLMARRLVEAEVPFVTVNQFGFDHHERIVQLLDESLPPVDQAAAALIQDLSERGLLDRVLVCLCTDFGRDQMNNIAGRHHWPDCGIAMLSGGGMRAGQVIGASDRSGRFPTQTPLQPPDVLAAIYHHLKIPLTGEFPDYSGRPIPINNGGRLIPQLYG